VRGESACAHNLYKAHERVLSQLQDELLTGEVVSDRATIERLVRVVGVLLRLHDRHRLDQHGQCAICWPIPRTWWRPWPKRSICTIHAALAFFLPHSNQAKHRRNDHVWPLSEKVHQHAPEQGPS
jgi:hypothetical protein